jgi:hypothetical protein
MAVVQMGAARAQFVTQLPPPMIDGQLDLRGLIARVLPLFSGSTMRMATG